MNPERLVTTKEQIQHYWNCFENKQIGAPDLAALCWLSYYYLFPESLSYQIQLKNQHYPGTKMASSYPFQQDAFIMEILNLKKDYPLYHLYDFFNSSYFKNTKSYTNKALCLWYQNKFELIPMNYVPTPIEVLKLQTQRRRCISLLFQEEELTHTFEHDRNVLQFMLHDLEHAWQMFSQPPLTTLQVQLSERLLALFEEGVVDFLQEHPETKKNLEYIFSDMNTHPEHTVCSLKALILSYFKLTSFSPEKCLSPQKEHEFHVVWQSIQSKLIKAF